jgi:hypothetical protein
MEKSRVTDIAFASPSIVILRILQGRIEGGVQEPYVVKAGDCVEEGESRKRWILRDGKRYGVLVNGVDGQKIWLPERYIEQSVDNDALTVADNYRLTAPDGAKTPAVSHVEAKYKPVDGSEPGFRFVNEYYISITLNEAMSENAAYVLTCTGLGCAPDELRFS